ncbi:MerR family DNA-binding transcriptional regulator, partial [Bacillus altitudinis]
MSTYFTIGEISKFFNIPIKTLRYYDEINLL